MILTAHKNHELVDTKNIAGETVKTHKVDSNQQKTPNDNAIQSLEIHCNEGMTSDGDNDKRREPQHGSLMA